MLTTLKKNYSISKYFKEAAEKAELVYFGGVDNEDEIARHKGITFSANSKDSHVCHGTINDYDVSLFSRSATHSNHENQSSNASWTIVTVKLKAGGFPNLIIDSKKHDKVFYQSVFTRFPKLRRGNELLSHINQTAAQYFDLFIAPQSAISTLNMLDDSMLQRMVQQFGSYDVQIEDNTLTVFSRGDAHSAKQLNDMIKEAIWIAEKIEYKNAYSDAAINTAAIGVF